MNQLRYRPDIDGLRAIAVLLVMIYHAFPKLLSGGFVGVDVFFVISGFLISQIILSGLAQENFSFGEFYARRVRRIFPALLVVSTTVLFVSWWTFLPFEFAELNKQILAGIGFVLNFVLWKDAGYFDIQADLKPFLHLWSLAIEEQFYLFWPLLLWVSRRIRAPLPLVIGGLGVASFFLNIGCLAVDRSATFYFPLTRLWELASGGFLAWLYQSGRWEKFTSENPWLEGDVPDVLVAAGLALIFLGAILITKSDPYPGWWALLPTTGTLLAIVGGPSSNLSRRLLSLPALVGIGLISYPLYLWHWPLLVMGKILSPVPLSDLSRFALLSGSLPLAWATYLLVELPIRRSDQPGKKVIALGCCATILASISFINYQLKGETVGNRFNVPMSDWEMHFEKQKYWDWDWQSGQKYKGNATRVLVFGDSHGYDYFKALANDKSLDLAYLHLDRRCSAFGALTKVGFEDVLSHCNQTLNMVLKSKLFKEATILLYGMDWEANFESRGAEELYLSTLAKIRLRHPGLRIALFGPKPILGRDYLTINQILRHHPSIVGLAVFLKSLVSYREADYQVVRERAEHMGVAFIDVSAIYCTGGCTFYQDGQLAYFDNNHWTEFGGKVFFEKFKASKSYQDLFYPNPNNHEVKDN